MAEFAWSRLEPSPGDYQFAWLDRAIDTLASHHLKIILCTPSATPPKWLIDEHPSILPVDPISGAVRGFGSRRHYDFSSEAYLRKSLAISQKLVVRYAQHKAVVGWQTDNELACHNTALSGSDNAKQAFQHWCRRRYGQITRLNDAWGNVFWSMEYRSFKEIELPVSAVTQTNPAHQLAWRRFSSDQVTRFHNKHVELIKHHAPHHFITHNFIPMNETGVDNHELAAPLDFASFDNYPLGRTDQYFAHLPAEEFQLIMRTGHPDLSSYYFDQTRGLKHKGFWIMEQQPGPVNWANNNPIPQAGMVRLWTYEAFAHGASCVSYFRWRQVKFAQEQMHAGLLRPDQQPALFYDEIRSTIAEIKKLNITQWKLPSSKVAMITSPEGYWVSEIEQQSIGYDINQIQLTFYSALRALGLDVDFVTQNDDLQSYKLIVIPGLPIINDTHIQSFTNTDAHVVFGPRSGAKTNEFNYPTVLPPDKLQQVLPIQILAVETTRVDCTDTFEWNKTQYKSGLWREHIQCPQDMVKISTAEGLPILVSRDRFSYLATLTEQRFLQDFFKEKCRTLGIDTLELPPLVRTQMRGDNLFVFNYSGLPTRISLPSSFKLKFGKDPIPAYDIAIWQIR